MEDRGTVEVGRSVMGDGVRRGPLASTSLTMSK